MVKFRSPEDCLSLRDPYGGNKESATHYRSGHSEQRSEESLNVRANRDSSLRFAPFRMTGFAALHNQRDPFFFWESSHKVPLWGGVGGEYVVLLVELNAGKNQMSLGYKRR